MRFYPGPSTSAGLVRCLEPRGPCKAQATTDVVLGAVASVDWTWPHRLEYPGREATADHEPGQRTNFAGRARSCLEYSCFEARETPLQRGEPAGARCGAYRWQAPPKWSTGYRPSDRRSVARRPCRSARRGAEPGRAAQCPWRSARVVHFRNDQATSGAQTREEETSEERFQHMARLSKFTSTKATSSGARIFRCPFWARSSSAQSRPAALRATRERMTRTSSDRRRRPPSLCRHRRRGERPLDKQGG